MKAIRVLVLLVLVSCAHTGVSLLTVDNALIVEPVQIQPIAMYAGIWLDIADCIKIQAPDFSQVKFYVARLLITDSGRLAYGMTLFNDNGPYAIIIDREYWLHPWVLSHEIEHYQRKSMLETDLQCEMHIPARTSVRVMSADSIEYYRGLAER